MSLSSRSGFVFALRFKLRGNETEPARAFAFTPVVGPSCEMSVAGRDSFRGLEVAINGH